MEQNKEQAWPIESIDSFGEEGRCHVRLKGGIKLYAWPSELAAAGLTPPEPHATITLPDGRSVEVPVKVLETFWAIWAKSADTTAGVTARHLDGLFADSDRNPT